MMPPYDDKLFSCLYLCLQEDFVGTPRFAKLADLWSQKLQYSPGGTGTTCRGRIMDTTLTESRNS